MRFIKLIDSNSDVRQGAHLALRTVDSSVALCTQYTQPVTVTQAHRLHSRPMWQQNVIINSTEIQ